MSHRSSTTTSPNVHANTPVLDTTDTSTIAVAVSSVLVVILLVVLGIILWRKKKTIWYAIFDNFYYNMHFCDAIP